MISQSQLSPDSSKWESMLPGQPGRNNGGAADISDTGFLAYACGSSLSVVFLYNPNRLQRFFRNGSLVSVGNLEAAVSLLLSTSSESNHFYVNSLRAVALASAVSKSLLELAVKVVAANMVRTDKSLSVTHLLCAVGRHQEACSQLQDAGCWTDAATLAATHLKGSDYSRVLQRWADHVLHSEHNLWRALILYVAAGAFREALTALREAQQPDTAAMFIVACQEIHGDILANMDGVEQRGPESSSSNKEHLNLPDFSPENQEVIAADELYGQYQRKLVHLCMDSQPFSD